MLLLLTSKSGYATLGHRGGSPTVREVMGKPFKPSLTVGLPPRPLTTVPISRVLI